MQLSSSEVKAHSRVLTEKQAARYINMSLAFLRNARCYRPDLGPKFLKLGRAVRYRIEDLDAWLESRARGGGEDAR
jgi:predicted DNA-binding transcriptional regulator AlpA